MAKCYDMVLCLECDKMIEPTAEVDIQLCDGCMGKFDVEELWRLHDDKKLNALDFNESASLRESFRIKKRGKA